jgi:hypothetical protein
LQSAMRLRIAFAPWQHERTESAGEMAVRSQDNILR